MGFATLLTRLSISLALIVGSAGGAGWKWKNLPL